MKDLKQIIKTAKEVIRVDNNESVLIFDNKEDAENASENLKELWPNGFGAMYGPFIDKKGSKQWFEVSIPTP